MAAEQAALKARFETVLGYWDPACDQMLAISPDYFAAYVNYIAAPWKAGALTPKTRELIYITINASTTHLHAPALRLHIAQALRHGATAGEIIEVFQLISVLGIHGVSMSMPILIEEAEAAGRGVYDRPYSPQQERIKAGFLSARGFWNPNWDAVLALLPDFMEAHVALSDVTIRQGTLEPKIREFILTAVDAATTHLWQPGVRYHARSALRYGATVEELAEVIAITSILGLHSMTFAMPILNEELSKLDHAS